MRSCLWKLEPGFWNYGWVRLLGPNGPNVLSRSQAPSSIIFLKFHDFIGFISSFVRKWGLVCENSSKGSGLMAAYFFWVQVAQINKWFLGSRSQGQDSFWDFMILLDSSHHLWENEVLFVKIRARVLDLCYGWIRVLGPSGPNIVFRPQQVPRSRQFLRFYDFIVFISSFLRKWVSVCEDWSQGSGLMLWLDTSSGPSRWSLTMVKTNKPCFK